MIPKDYSQPFAIEGAVGNNAFAYERRGATPTLWVPSLIAGEFDDVAVGERVAFEDVDEHGRLHSCVGLAHIVRTSWRGIPVVVMDNHNHAFYFWFEAERRGVIAPGATLVHIDQHRDTRVPDRMFEGRSLEDAFDYTNFHLNVGNYIVPAERAGLIGEIEMVTGETALRQPARSTHASKILNIDLDFFAPEMSYIDFGLAVDFIGAHLPTTSLVTIATSPFFIDQALSVRLLHRLVSAARLK